MSNDNIIKLGCNNDTEDISRKNTISLKKAAEILGVSYHKARRTVLNSREIGFFNYDGNYAIVEEDVRNYKRSRYIKPSRSECLFPPDKSKI